MKDKTKENKEPKFIVSWLITMAILLGVGLIYKIIENIELNLSPETIIWLVATPVMVAISLIIAMIIHDLRSSK